VDEDLKRIAHRLRSWRSDAGLTLQRLGDLSGVSASTIHKMENLQTVPTISVLLKVAHGLNRRPSELLAEVEVGRKVSVIRSKERPSLKVVPGATAEHLIGMIPHNKLDACVLGSNRKAVRAWARRLPGISVVRWRSWWKRA